MELELIATEGYSQLFNNFLGGSACVLIVASMFLIIAQAAVLVENASASRKTIIKLLFGIAVAVIGVVMLCLYLTNPTKYPYDTDASYASIQAEAEEVYGLELTTQDIAALTSRGGFWNDRSEKERLAFYGDTTTLNQNDEIVKIQLVQIKGEFQLVYADGEPTKLEELERKS